MKEKRAFHFLPADLRKDKALFFLWVLALLIRCVVLSYTSVWIDEAFSLHMAQLSPMQMIAALMNDRGEPLYYLLLKMWCTAFGRGDWTAASLSAVISSITPLVLYRFTFEVMQSRAAALWVVFCSAFNPASLFQSDNIRFYSLLELESALSGLYFFRLLRGNTSWKVYSGVSIIGVYTHTYFWFALIAEAIVMLCLGRQRIVIFCKAYACLALCYSPWTYILWYQLHNSASDQLPQIANGWDGISIFFFSLGQKIAGQSFLLSYVTGCIVLLWIYSFVLLFKKKIELTKAPQPLGNALGMVLFITVAIGLPIACSLFKPIFLVGRYDTIINGQMIVLLGWGIAQIKKPVLQLVYIALLLVVPLSWLKWKKNAFEEVNDKISVQKLVQQMHTLPPGKYAVLYSGLSRLAAEYYLQSMHVHPDMIVTFPQQMGEYPACIPADVYRWMAEGMNLEREKGIERVKKSECRYLIYFSAEKEAAFGFACRQYAERLEQEFYLVWKGEVSAKVHSPMYQVVYIYDLMQRR